MIDSIPTPIVCGPTAGGKSELALRVARALKARGVKTAILAADAFQVYKGLDIASAKPTHDERAEVEHLLLDLVPASERFNSSDWLEHAQRAIADCRARNVLPIVVGGTHLYVKLLVDGMFEGPAANEQLRNELRAMGLPALREELQRTDPAAATRIHPNDERRTIRAIEVFRLTGKPISDLQNQWDGVDEIGRVTIGNEAVPEGRRTYHLFLLDWPNEPINRRINARVKQMMERGMLEETRSLRAQLGPTAREALGTKQLLAHLEGKYPLEEAVERIKIETRRFAKNQRTWLKRLRVMPPAKAAVTVLEAGDLMGASGLPEPPMEDWCRQAIGYLLKYEQNGNSSQNTRS